MTGLEIIAEQGLARSIVDAAPDGILVADVSGSIVLTNRRAEELFGYAPGELIGRNVDDLLPTRLRAAHAAQRAGYRADPRTRPMSRGMTLVARRKDGTELPVEIGLSPLEHDGHVATVAAVRDVTDRLAEEERLQATERALQLVEERERIARDLHDTVIQQLFAAGMRLQAVTPSLVDADVTTRIDRVVESLDDTIRAIRAAIFELRVDIGAIGLRGAIMRVVADERPALGMEPRVHFDGLVEAVPEPVAAHLLPVVREALSNVARHADATAVGVTVDAHDGVELRVTDDGVGITDRARAGFGLRNAAERAKALGGTCSVTRRAEGGTELIWRVPAT